MDLVIENPSPDIIRDELGLGCWVWVFRQLLAVVHYILNSPVLPPDKGKPLFAGLSPLHRKLESVREDCHVAVELYDCLDAVKSFIIHFLRYCHGSYLEV